MKWLSRQEVESHSGRSRFRSVTILCGLLFFFLVSGAHSQSTVVAEFIREETGNVYIVVHYPEQSWDAAAGEIAVLRADYHLATVTSEAEQQFLIQKMSDLSVGGTWLGGIQSPFDEEVADANWTWVTGEPWTYSNWSPGEPNDGGTPGLEQHLAMEGWFAWNDCCTGLGGHYGFVGESADSDSDRTPDFWEKANLFNPEDPNDGSADVDSDGLKNFEEYLLATDPRVSDTDGDGINDGDEVLDGTDPLDAADCSICGGSILLKIVPGLLDQSDE